jgi:hypothetical protein
MTPEELDDVIDLVIKSDVSAEKAFGFSLTTKTYVPKRTCLTASYSPAEAMVSAVLLQFYIEIHGVPDYLNAPEGRKWTNSPADLVWPGAFYLVSASHEITEPASWKVIKKLLP